MVDCAVAGTKTMNFKLVSMIEKIEVVKVTDIEGVVIGVLDRKGLSMFENGDIATTTCRGTFSEKKPNWDKAFKIKGFTYFEWTGTYDLSSQ